MQPHRYEALNERGFFVCSQPDPKSTTGDKHYNLHFTHPYLTLNWELPEEQPLTWTSRSNPNPAALTWANCMHNICAVVEGMDRESGETYCPVSRENLNELGEYLIEGMAELDCVLCITKWVGPGERVILYGMPIATTFLLGHTDEEVRRIYKSFRFLVSRKAGIPLFAEEPDPSLFSLNESEPDEPEEPSTEGAEV